MPMKDLKNYMELQGRCPVNGVHKLTLSEWPYVKCEYCHQEYVLFSRELVEYFFDIDVFAMRLNS